jgi:hypothetical protein
MYQDDFSQIGTIAAFAGPASTIPEADGWLPCDGRPLPRVGEYAPLFAVLGTLHGAGDGATTFNLPDYQGYFLRGVAAGGQVGGAQDWATAMPRNAFAAAPVGDHEHKDPTWNGVEGGRYELATAIRAAGGYDYGDLAAPTSPAGWHGHKITGGDDETRPVNKHVHWIIKARARPLRIRLRAAHGAYAGLAAAGDALLATAEVPGDAETFSLVPLEPGRRLYTGSAARLRARDGRHLGVSSEGAVSAGADPAGEGAVFVLCSVDMDQSIHTGSRVALRASDGRYLTIRDGAVLAAEAQIGIRETWLLEQV